MASTIFLLCNCQRPDALTCALAFDVQIFDKIPKEDHDKQMDYVITENGCI